MQRSRLVVFVIAAFVAMADARLAPAQEQIIYSFVSESSGYNPHDPMAIDSQGNLYGIMTGGIFKLSPPSEAGGQWTEQELYDSLTVPGLHSPSFGLVLDAKGNLYGISPNDTEIDGQSILGYVAEVSPPSTAGGTWNAQIIYMFLESNSVANCGDPKSYLTIDSKGNLYGTCTNGGANGVGGVYELSPPTEAGGQWTEQLIHSFAQDGVDGNSPQQNAGLIFDAQGNLYGATVYGGTDDAGVVYELSPRTGGEWTETILFNFVLSGPNAPYGAVVFDHQGNLYTTTYDGGTGGVGAVVELSPPAKQGSEWTLTQLYAFSGKTTDGRNPDAGVLFDSAGNLWGTTFHGGPYYQTNQANSDGALFELMPQSGGGWQEVVRHFFGGPGDVFSAAGPMVMDSKGNLYGAGSEGINNCGNITCGGIFEYTPSASTPAAPAISSGGIVSAAAFGGFTSVSPGSWIEIYGSNLASDTRSWGSSDFNGSNAPTSLDGTSVSVGGQAAFVDFISPGQVNALIPSNVATGSQQIMVKTAGGTSATVDITINAVQPGLLAPPSFQVNGVQYAVALFSDGTYVLPEGAIPGVTSRPAKPGDEIVLYGVGFGPVTPDIPAGEIVSQSNKLASSFEMSVGGKKVTPAYAGLAPSYTGLYQFNITVPDLGLTGASPLVFTVDGVSGTQTLYIATGN